MAQQTTWTASGNREANDARAQAEFVRLRRLKDPMYAKDTSHLVALQTRLAHELARFAADGSEIRKVWIAQIEREIAHEERHLGIESTADLPEMSDDELLAELV